ncbi:esterase/lipase family protein [Nocardioides limicola]|uniref:esterase/lipase family protein n=1 Tax=Nocardioides limicola TaxID=2803368 RepID=UPI00193C84B4|nr:alpha/beta fold hydrolase [Nocardioides sp. DJM-14]
MRRVLTCLTGLLVALTLLGAPAHADEAPLPVSYNFLVSAVLAGIQVDADPPGANDWTCQPTRQHPRPVVLVHGTIGNKNTNWQTYAPLLKNHGYCVFALTYGVEPGTPLPLDQFGGMSRMERSAEQLAAFIAEVRRATGARKVDLIGHSQGTLMPNYYVKFLGGAKHVKRYVSLAPLWHGTEISTATTLAQAFGINPADLPPCHACGQFYPGSEFLEQLRAGGMAAAGVEYTNIMTRYDQLVVPYTSGHEEGMRNIVVQDVCGSDYSEHFQIASDPVAAQLVLNTLDPRNPAPVPCPLVLSYIGPLY